MIKYSIILRAYNAGKCVSGSIESIMEQSYSNWELIIVNDGSTDDTGAICEEYAKKDNRIKVVHQENKGCLLATQTGIEHSQGEYICLIDSDDWYDEKYLECIESIVSNNEVDMIVTNYYTVDSSQKKYEFCLTKEDFIADNIKAMEIFLETTNYALWNKVVKKDKIQYNPGEKQFFIKYGKQTNFGDDLYQLMPVLCGCKNVYFTSKYLYNYVVAEESISHQRVKDQWEELFKRNRLMRFTYETINKRSCINEKIRNLIENNTLNLLLPGIVEIVQSRKMNRSAVMKLKQDLFYRNVIMRMKFSYVIKKYGKKKAIAFVIFNIMILCSSHD